ncbi:hypothetical protein CYR55_17750 [Chimaeribacter californicus]|uniref:Uncharacterized protein n=1 Tax=Chimaeribacter californicus TaxID=2060067 RepID=A0A2N5DZ78_9GAMM|nr:hypothetical protein [Chimaeribacter californicus]PLR33053.1 hypothetical protein CYR55_17750 [Chimaeribacter californicus]
MKDTPVFLFNRVHFFQDINTGYHSGAAYPVAPLFFIYFPPVIPGAIISQPALSNFFNAFPLRWQRAIS